MDILQTTELYIFKFLFIDLWEERENINLLFQLFMYSLVDSCTMLWLRIDPATLDTQTNCATWLGTRTIFKLEECHDQLWCLKKKISLMASLVKEAKLQIVVTGDWYRNQTKDDKEALVQFSLLLAFIAFHLWKVWVSYWKMKVCYKAHLCHLVSKLWFWLPTLAVSQWGWGGSGRERGFGITGRVKPLDPW